MMNWIAGRKVYLITVAGYSLVALLACYVHDGLKILLLAPLLLLLNSSKIIPFPYTGSLSIFILAPSILYYSAVLFAPLLAHSPSRSVAIWLLPQVVLLFTAMSLGVFLVCFCALPIPD
jgi:hypothetical protein